MSVATRLLIVEDEEPIRQGLADVFRFHGFDVETAADGTTGLERALTGRYDMVLLDLMLPGIDGTEICERVREACPDQPVIMLTARTSDEDVIRGLSLGADDYVAKPFSVAELVLRVQAVLRRTSPGARHERVLHLAGDVEIDPANLAGRRGQEPLRFTRREMELLEYLAVHADRAVPREELLARVWGYGRGLGIETRTVDIHVAKLRRKIEAVPGEPAVLVTVRGAGYRLRLA
ncbi:MAG: response regulator transcription factor [Pseudomonadota bacterium]